MNTRNLMDSSGRQRGLAQRGDGHGIMAFCETFAVLIKHQRMMQIQWLG